MPLEATHPARRIVDLYVHKDGTRYFRINWRDTWEPEAHLVDCQPLLQNFWNTRENGSKKETNGGKIEQNKRRTSAPVTSCSCKSSTKYASKSTQFGEAYTAITRDEGVQVDLTHRKTCSRGLQFSPHMVNIGIQHQQTVHCQASTQVSTDPLVDSSTQIDSVVCVDECAQFDGSFSNEDANEGVYIKDVSFQHGPTTTESGVQNVVAVREESTQCREDVFQRAVGAQCTPSMSSCGVQKDILSVEKFTQCSNQDEEGETTNPLQCTSTVESLFNTSCTPVEVKSLINHSFQSRPDWHTDSHTNTTTRNLSELSTQDYAADQQQDYASSDAMIPSVSVPLHGVSDIGDVCGDQALDFTVAPVAVEDVAQQKPSMKEMIFVTDSPFTLKQQEQPHEQPVQINDTKQEHGDQLDQVIYLPPNLAYMPEPTHPNQSLPSQSIVQYDDLGTNKATYIGATMENSTNLSTSFTSHSAENVHSGLRCTDPTDIMCTTYSATATPYEQQHQQQQHQIATSTPVAAKGSKKKRKRNEIKTKKDGSIAAKKSRVKKTLCIPKSAEETPSSAFPFPSHQPVIPGHEDVTTSHISPDTPTSPQIASTASALTLLPVVNIDTSIVGGAYSSSSSSFVSQSLSPCLPPSLAEEKNINDVFISKYWS